MISIPSDYTIARSLQEKTVYAISLLRKGSAEEVATEIAELQGVASEDGLSDLLGVSEEDMGKLMTDGMVV